PILSRERALGPRCRIGIDLGGPWCAASAPVEDLGEPGGGDVDGVFDGGGGSVSRVHTEDHKNPVRQRPSPAVRGGRLSPSAASRSAASWVPWPHASASAFSTVGAHRRRPCRSLGAPTARPPAVPHAAGPP